MLIYLSFLLPPLILAWPRPPLKRRVAFSTVAYFVALLLFMGLRDRTGPDWDAYVKIYEVVNRDLETDLIEPLFIYLNVLSSALGFYVYGVNFACTFIFLIGVFAYARCTARPWLAIAVVTPYLCFVVGMSGIRQAAAIGVIYIALANWQRLSLIAKLLFIAVAASFHTSALFFVLLIVFDDLKRFWLKIIFAGLFIVYLLRSSSVIDVVDEYSDRYFRQDIISYGAMEHVALSTFPAIMYFIFKKRIAKAGWDNHLVTIGATASIIALPLTLISSTAVDRLALYFSYIQMWIYPALIEAFGDHEVILLICTSGIILFVFFVYFTFGFTVSEYLDYNNLLFEQ